jgi:dihydropteridine reductase
LLNKKFNTILVTAGGWKGGNIKSEAFIKDYEQMRDMNLLPCLYAGNLAATHLENEGLIVFLGAAAVFKEPQPEMLAYSLAKTGVHSLALNLSQSKVLPEDTTVVTILPETIDTPSNREAMPKANFDEWANPRHIAELLKGWIDGMNRPSTGSFAVLKVKNKSIVPEFV